MVVKVEVPGLVESGKADKSGKLGCAHCIDFSRIGESVQHFPRMSLALSRLHERTSKHHHLIFQYDQSLIQDFFDLIAHRIVRIVWFLTIYSKESVVCPVVECKTGGT